ncbi:hypothetical protein K504DRAFT_145980 [Pleomassaria siparia CBS 279.74]|uniref:Uncharacterized protein n=1 Tax=Pleomassaria siparia CBS 279.74 TaxID=1314801 RepID=A0A6G1KLN6_9PLEO|nr:hypothetical protein K504DRAFT_145980 [Pleomassaria siparia CBS 279.74]
MVVPSAVDIDKTGTTAFEDLVSATTILSTRYEGEMTTPMTKPRRKSEPSAGPPSSNSDPNSNFVSSLREKISPEQSSPSQLTPPWIDSTGGNSAPPSFHRPSLGGISSPFAWTGFAPLAILVAIWTFGIVQTWRNKHYGKRSTAHLLREKRWVTQLGKAWKTKNYPILFGLSELWITGAIPWGPWDVSGLKEVEDMEYYKQLCHAGIIPLDISTGGFGTKEKSSIALDKKARLGFRMPVWVQSHRRAYFDFVMPLIRGKYFNNRVNFLNSLLVHEGPRDGIAIRFWVREDPPRRIQLEDTYASALQSQFPLEYGASTWNQWTLPFLKDTALKRRTERWEVNLGNYMSEDQCPLLIKGAYVLVRVEALTTLVGRLDGWIARVAGEFGLNGAFNGAYNRTLTKAWLNDYDLSDLPGVSFTTEMPGGKDVRVFTFKPSAADKEFPDDVR